jgi:hypothetical protein
MNCAYTRNAGLAGGVLILAFGLLLLTVGLGDFSDDATSAMLPAGLAFICGIALASVCWGNIAANIRHR